MPRLVDEISLCWDNARDQAMLLNRGAYVWLIIFRPGEAWFYDSHGYEYSSLRYFSVAEALLRFVLQMCGVSDENLLQENIAQLHNPSLRHPDGDFDATVARPDAFELVVLERLDTSY